MTDLSKAIKGLENELIKAKYIRRVPDGKGGWNYIYKESGKKEKKEEKKGDPTLKELRKKAEKKGGVFEITVDTDFIGDDDITYDAKATLAIDKDGSYYVDSYKYFKDGKWNNTQELDWEKDSIESTFNVKL